VAHARNENVNWQNAQQATLGSTEGKKCAGATAPGNWGKKRTSRCGRAVCLKTTRRRKNGRQSGESLQVG